MDGATSPRSVCCRILDLWVRVRVRVTVRVRVRVRDREVS